MNQNQIASKDAKKKIKDAKKENPIPAKSSNAQRSSNVKKNSDASIVEINLSKFADQLGKIELKEKKERETIYHYPEGMTKELISSEKGKRYRNGLRNQLKRFSNNCLLYAKHSRIDDLKEEIKKFDEFYLKFYRINDYSIGSISQSNDDAKNANYSLFLDILKSLK